MVLHETVKVLMVEDNPGDVLLVRAMLDEVRTGGFDLASVGRLDAAEERLAGEEFDVVLLDLSLPDSHGLETVGRVRSVAPHTPVVVLSGTDDEAVAIQALQSGAQDYLIKGRGDGDVVTRSIRYAIERERAESALRESEERFRTVVESLGEGLLITDSENVVLYANSRMTELSGYATEELLHRPAYEMLLPPVRWEEALRRNGERMAGIPERYELRLVRKDGTEFWTEINATPYRNSAGEIVGSLRAIIDITERRRFEEALKESEERFRSLVQHASDIITVLDADGMIRYESPAVEKVLGYRPEDLIGTNAFSYLHPDDRERVARIFAGVLREPGDARPVEFRFRHADGSWRCLEGIGNNLVDDPVVGGIVVNSRDITGRKTTEGQLRRSLDALLALYEAGQILGSTLESEEIADKLLDIVRRVAGPEACVLRLADGRGTSGVLRASGPDDLLSRMEEADAARVARRAALETGERRSFRLPGRGPEPGVGIFLPLRTGHRVIGVLEAYGGEALGEKSSGDFLGGLAAQAASALENARLYGELSEREQRLEDLVSKLIQAQEEERRRVAYELHDGLTQVVAAAHQHLQAFAHYHPPEEPERRRELERALGLVRRAVGDSRRVIADLRPTELDDFGLATAIRMRIDELREEGWRISYDADPQEVRLPPAVETALFRVFQEALTNVRKHARSDRARVTLRRGEHDARLEVRDWGQGFSPGEASAANGRGERIGLSGMRERVALLGGEFEIESRPGAGTVVVATVPLKAEEAERDG